MAAPDLCVKVTPLSPPLLTMAAPDLCVTVTYAVLRSVMTSSVEFYITLSPDLCIMVTLAVNLEIVVRGFSYVV